MSRINLSEWLLGAGGAVMVIGLFLPWSDGNSGIGSLDGLIVLLALVGITALLVPAIVAASRLTDVPIVWETLLWLASVPLLLVFLVVVFLTPPGFDWDIGMWLTLTGLIAVGLAGWRSVRREH